MGGVADDALDVLFGFLERDRLDKLIHLGGQCRSPRADAAGTGVIGDGDVFDSAKFCKLVLHVGRTQFDIQRRVIQILGGGRAARRPVAAGDELCGWQQQLHEAVSISAGFCPRAEDCFLPDKSGNLIAIEAAFGGPFFNIAPIGERVKHGPFILAHLLGKHLRIVGVALLKGDEGRGVVAL